MCTKDNVLYSAKYQKSLTRMRNDHIRNIFHAALVLRTKHTTAKIHPKHNIWTRKKLILMQAN